MVRSIAARLPPLPTLPALPGRGSRTRLRGRRGAPRTRAARASCEAGRTPGAPARRVFFLRCSVLALPLLAGGWLWLRSSPLVAIDHVRVEGVSGPQAHTIERALAVAARRMTTLAPDDGSLRAAVARFPQVRALRAVTHFPHSIVIEVSEQLPVALLEGDGARTALAADGVALGPALATGELPKLALSARVPAPGALVGPSEARAALTLLGAAPAAMRTQVSQLDSGSRGLELQMRDGLTVYFGTDADPRAKWIALARVLADPSSRGASYVDVRLPERPAAGFAAGSTQAAEAATVPGSEPTAAAGGEESVEALAEQLRHAAGVSSAPTPEAGQAGSTAGLAGAATAPATSTPSTGGETASGAGATAAEGAAGASAAVPETSAATPGEAAGGAAAGAAPGG